MSQETLRKLMEMKMDGMADIYQQQSQNRDYQKMDFEDCFQLLVDFEYDCRCLNKLGRLIKQATLNEPTAAIEDI